MTKRLQRPRPICPREKCGSTHVTVGKKYGICNRCCVKAPAASFLDYPKGTGETRSSVDEHERKQKFLYE